MDSWMIIKRKNNITRITFSSDGILLLLLLFPLALHLHLVQSTTADNNNNNNGFDERVGGGGIHRRSPEHLHSYNTDHKQNKHDGSGGSNPSGNSNLALPGNCHLPQSWKGKWFQSGFPSPITIDDKSIGHKGVCLERSGNDKFLFYHAPTNCHKCVVIIEHHVNILQYKETQYCEEKDILDHLCSEIPGDASLHSLFRIDAQPIECPFKGAPFTFTYNRGHGICRDPVSHVDTCNDNSRLLLRYQACPDVQKTESTLEELECLATWKEGSNHYLIGKLYSRPLLSTHENEERYRCFVFETIKNHSTTEVDAKGHSPTIGYKVAQSGDASCTGVTSTDTGARALTFNIVDHAPSPKCKFPQWVGAHHWHTLDSKISVKLHSKGSILHVQEENKKNNTLYSNFGSESTFPNKGKLIPPQLISSGSKIVCQSSKEISEHHVSILAQQKEGCNTEMVCLNIYKRHGHVIELRLQKQSSHEDHDCSKKVYQDESDASSPYVTLISSSAHSLRCPNLGKYMASGVSQDGRVLRDTCGNSNGNEGAFNTLVVGCNDKGTMEFHSKCSTDEPITSYTCHGSWEESGTKYLIASPMSRSSNSARRYCFIYTKNGGSGLRVSSSSESCRRNISPGIGGSWAFNLTSNGQCAERLISNDGVNNYRRSFSLYSIGFYLFISMYSIQFLISISLSSFYSSNSIMGKER